MGNDNLPSCHFVMSKDLVSGNKVNGSERHNFTSHLLRLFFLLNDKRVETGDKYRVFKFTFESP